MNIIVWPPQAKISNSATGFVVFLFLEYILIYFIKNEERERELDLSIQQNKKSPRGKRWVQFFFYFFFSHDISWVW